MHETHPTASADQTALTRIEKSFAGDAGGWKEKVQRGADGAVQLEPHDCVGFSASHIAARSGARPNQSSNANAPCSTSIVSPSAAVCPRARASRTSAVSW